MYGRIKYLFLLLLVLQPRFASAQISEVQNQVEAILEATMEEMEENADGSIILDDLEELMNDKLNINTATALQLSKLHLLNDLRIDELIRHREEYGPFYSIYELNAVESLNPEIIKKMEPFIWFGPIENKTLTFGEKLKYGRNEFLLRTQGILQKPAGYIKKEDATSPFEGERMRHYTRYKFTATEEISAGFTAEKDPGESMFKGSNKYGFDFHSAYINLKINKLVQDVIVGDYIAKGGQGLVLWQGFSLGKSINTLSLSKTNQGVRPYTSADENNYFRGIATSLRIKKAQLNAFISRKNLDGNIETSDSLGSWFTSFQSSGYHRTVNEIEDKHSVKDFNAGALMNWQLNNLRLGTVLLYRQFVIPCLPPDQLYNRFNFRGKINKAAGINYLYSKGKYVLFGEAAVSGSAGKAIVHGAEMYLHDRIQVSTLFRHLDKDYQALWASPFCENSTAANETGLYIGTRILPIKHVILTAYSDFFKSPWTKYTTSGPSQGREVFIQSTFTPDSRLQFYLRLKSEDKDKKRIIDEKYINLSEQVTRLRLHCQYQPFLWLILKSRLEHISYKGLNKENGVLFFQDTQFLPERLKVNLTFRLAWFQTDSYNTRIYTYENDLLYVFSIPAFFGEGIRTYLNLKYKMNNKIEIWFKLANLVHNDVESIGSGYNKIVGNQKTELKFQLRFKL